MLTRLRAEGFKNLVDFELRFGPLTCIAGPNGVGKSNVFDAIRFLSLLADHDFAKAASGVRGGTELTALFAEPGASRMRFECDILIPTSGSDDFGQPAEASHTFLTYAIALRLDHDEAFGLPRIALDEESLTYITRTDSSQRLGFPHHKDWREGVLGSSTRRTPFISTEPGTGGERAKVRLHADRMRDDRLSKRGGGRPSDYPMARLPRSVLSSAQNAEEFRTAVLVRQEMRRWRILQLEPSALRMPDELVTMAESHIDASGAHVPATLRRLASQSGNDGRVYAEIGNRLGELVDNVQSVRVDRDDVRRVLQFMLMDRNRVELPASSLSDGTLRFVALAVIERDPEATGVLCLEEPENGIHPERMVAMLSLLKDMAVDTNQPVDADNPLRQVVLSTHSPLVALGVGTDELVFARARSQGDPAKPSRGIEALAIDGTWRHRQGAGAIALGELLRYLGTMALPAESSNGHERVIDALGAQLPLPFGEPPT